MNVFETLSQIDVNEFTEHKGQFTYLSWSDAVSELLRIYPEATWEVVHDSHGYPYFPCPAGAFVKVRLTVEGITREQVHPVLDHRNKAISEPDAFQVNTSIQRCLAKAISLHGLGLYIYRGEDLPDITFRFKPGEKDEIQKQFRLCLDNGDELGLRQMWDEYDNDAKQKIWTLFSAAERSTIKALLDETKKDNDE